MQPVAEKTALLTALARYGVSTASAVRTERAFHPVAPAFDLLLNQSGMQFGAVHELLYPPRKSSSQSTPRTAARILLAAIHSTRKGLLVWSDPLSELVPQAIAQNIELRIDLRRVMLLRPKNFLDEIAMLTECLRSRAVAAVVADVRQLSPLQARRLQLAAEQGGGAGILLRPNDRRAAHYAAATRWLVEPAPGSDRLQRWNVTLLHGHGGQVGSTALLEIDRETNSVHPPAAFPDRSAQTPTPKTIPNRAIA